MIRLRVLIPVMASFTLIVMIIGLTMSVSGQVGTTYIYLPIVNNKYDASWHWGSPSSITLTKSIDMNGFMPIIGDDGRLHLIWSSGSSPRQIYHMYFDGTEWSEAEMVRQPIETGKLMYRPLLTDDGQIHLVWYESLGSGFEKPYRIMHARYDGAIWGEPEVVYRTNLYYIQAMPHKNDQGDLFVSTLENSGDISSHRFKKIDGGWEASEVIEPGHLIHWVWPDMDGGVRFYGSDNNNRLWYSHWLDGVYLKQSYQMAGTVNPRTLQLDGDNNLNAFWPSKVLDETNPRSGLYQQCLSADLEWSAIALLTGSGAFAGTVLEVASDAVSRTALAWKEYESKRFRFGVWRGCISETLQDIPFLDPARETIDSIVLSDSPDKLCVIARKSVWRQYYVLCADRY